MKNFLKQLLSGLALLLLMVGQSYAQSPEAFKYQAVVRDANYAPIANQVVKIRITILQGAANGTMVYQETHEPTTTAIGLVALNIGEGSSLSGTFSSIDWGSYAYWLEVEVDQYGGNNYVWMGSSKLQSVPYALYAKKAASVDNVDDADADPTNELQTLSVSGNDLSISNGNTVSLNPDDADADPTNEIQNISIDGRKLSITQGDTVLIPGQDLVAGDGIAINGDTIVNIKPTPWSVRDTIIFADTTQSVGIGIEDTTTFPTDSRLYVNGNIRVSDGAKLLRVGEILGFRGIRLSARPLGAGDVVIDNAGRTTFNEEVGINQVFTFVDLNVRNKPGNSTVFQAEDSAGVDLFEVGRDGNVGINQITNNVTLQVQNKTKGTNNIIFNVERANGDNVLQVQDDQDVVVTGDFSVNNGAKNFILDHPLDPANKVLAHNAVESPDFVTYYHGTVQMDANGQAVVDLPDYFEALNTDYHYQLTCIGGFAQVYISGEIQNNRFSIAGGQPGMKVSWQVSAKRNDPWAKDHPYESEIMKEGSEIGKYYYPEGYGKGRDFKIGSSVINGEDQ